MDHLKQILLDEIPAFKEKGEKFLSGEMNKMEFKKASGGFGIYAHRDGKSFMIRLRILSGMLSKKQLKEVYELAKEHDAPLVHLTTRQAIQFHHLSLEDVCEIMKEALEYGIYTRGSGGNFPRNIAISPLSGVDPVEAFDIVPYAQAGNQYFMERITTYHLPRKLKVSFSNSDEDTAHATVQDLGFLAVQKDGKNYFKIYGGGGLGRNPRVGVVLEEDADPKDSLYYIEAMVNLFREKGNYENHSKARVRYIVDTLGEEEFKATYKAYFNEAKEKGGLDIIEGEETNTVQKASTEKIEGANIIPQKQEGLYSLYCHPVGGQLTKEHLKSIIDCIEHMEEVSMRLGMTEGIYFLNLTAKEVKQLLQVIAPIQTETRLEQSVSCIGVPVCQMGVANSQQTLKNILEYFKEKGIMGDILPRVYISGCPNSCGVHQIGEIGLTGKIKRVGDKSCSCFELFVGGKVKEGESELGRSYGDIKEEDVPELLADLAVEVEKSQISFAEWINKDSERLNEIIRDYNV